jgi:DNA-binding beta-propeller fold protein YncE
VIDGTSDAILKRFAGVSNPSIFYPNYNFLSFDSLRGKIYFPGAGVSTISSKDWSFSSLENAPISGYPVKTVIDSANKTLYVLTTQGGVNIVDLDTKTVKTSFNIFEQLKGFNLKLRGSVGEAILSEKNKKAFILLNGADVIAVVDTETNKLDAAISNFGVQKVSGDIWGAITIVILIVLVVAIVTFIVWRYSQKPKFRKVE